VSGRSGTRIRSTRKPVVVLAGEDRNDRSSLRVVLEELCPQMRGRIVEINDVPRLRNARAETLVNRVEGLARLVRARGAREDAEVACVFIQEDLDQLDGDIYLKTRQRVQTALDATFPSAHYVLPVWELEAWLLLFPESLGSFVAGWNVPRQFSGVDTGRISDPKQVLMRSVTGTSRRRYRESDAPDLFGKAVALGEIHRPTGTNRSWAKFREDANACCGQHLPPTSGAHGKPTR